MMKHPAFIKQDIDTRLIVAAPLHPFRINTEKGGEFNLYTGYRGLNFPALLSVTSESGNLRFSVFSDMTGYRVEEVDRIDDLMLHPEPPIGRVRLYVTAPSDAQELTDTLHISVRPFYYGEERPSVSVSVPFTATGDTSLPDLQFIPGGAGLNQINLLNMLDEQASTPVYYTQLTMRAPAATEKTMAITSERGDLMFYDENGEALGSTFLLTLSGDAMVVPVHFSLPAGSDRDVNNFYLINATDTTSGEIITFVLSRFHGQSESL